jgi:hypothetical protein
VAGVYTGDGRLLDRSGLVRAGTPLLQAPILVHGWVRCYPGYRHASVRP